MIGDKKRENKNLRTDEHHTGRDHFFALPVLSKDAVRSNPKGAAGGGGRALGAGGLAGATGRSALAGAAWSTLGAEGLGGGGPVAEAGATGRPGGAGRSGPVGDFTEY